MTAANLAVIFGPNLLQREWGGDVSPHAMGIEDSTAIISITLVLIQNYRRLFTVSFIFIIIFVITFLLCDVVRVCVYLQVSAELQQEILMSLIQTDPDVIDYLLRRKLR